MFNASIILVMIFLHIMDDFVLQRVGALHFMKQKSWWDENAPQKLYKHDYIVAMLAHSFSWTFMVMLPLLFISGGYADWYFLMMFAYNMALHAFIDDAKANWKKINLITDQVIHIGQIVLTCTLMIRHWTIL